MRNFGRVSFVKQLGVTSRLVGTAGRADAPTVAQDAQCFTVPSPQIWTSASHHGFWSQRSVFFLKSLHRVTETFGEKLGSH